VRYQEVVRAIDLAIKRGWVAVELETGLGGPVRRGKPLEADAVQHAPVVLVAKTYVMIEATRVAPVSEIARGTGLVDALARALPNSDDGALVLQADQATDMVVINRVVATCVHAGFPNVLLAVKQSRVRTRVVCDVHAQNPRAARPWSGRRFA
jgi:biopolymer transport protein ExbD